METIYIITRDGKPTEAWRELKDATTVLELFKKEELLQKYEYNIQEITLWR